MDNAQHMIGDRVHAGAPGTEDFDEGTVRDVDSHLVEVCWDGGECVWQSPDHLKFL